jgi:hypothetical protein
MVKVKTDTDGCSCLKDKESMIMNLIKDLESVKTW